MDGVSDGAVSVHPKLNPISVSVKCGWIRQPFAITSSCTRKTMSRRYLPERLCKGIPKPRPSIEAVGVGHNEHSLSHVWGAHGARGTNRPLRIEPEVGKGSEYVAHSPSKQRCDVFQDREVWSHEIEDSGQLVEKAGSFAVKTGAVACIADVLAGEAAANDAGASSGRPEGPHVVVNRDAWPAGSEHGLAVGISLDEGGRAESRSLCCEVESADTGEE